MSVEINENETTHLFRTIMKRPVPSGPPGIEIDPAHDIAVLQYTEARQARQKASCSATATY